MFLVILCHQNMVSDQSRCQTLLLISAQYEIEQDNCKLGPKANKNLTLPHFSALYDFL